MKAYAVVIGPRRKVLAIALEGYSARYSAALRLDYQAIEGLSGSIHHVDDVLREHGARVVRIDFQLPKEDA